MRGESPVRPNRIARCRLFAALATGAVAAGCALPGARTEWPDSFVSRLAAHALIEDLNTDLLTSRSATETLEAWCATHRLAAPPRIAAYRIGAGDAAPSPAQRARLRVDADTPVGYRRVQLRCGERVLSEAENWYVPGRLTADMNRLLETTETPYGKVVRPLHPYRRTFAAQRLWSPLVAGWELEARPDFAPSGRPLAVPPALFEHRAVLYDANDRPLAELREVYQRALLDFPLGPVD